MNEIAESSRTEMEAFALNGWHLELLNVFEDPSIEYKYGRYTPGKGE